MGIMGLPIGSSGRIRGRSRLALTRHSLCHTDRDSAKVPRSPARDRLQFPSSGLPDGPVDLPASQPHGPAAGGFDSAPCVF